MYLKNLSIPKKLRTLKTNFEETDGLGISNASFNDDKHGRLFIVANPFQLICQSEIAL